MGTYLETKIKVQGTKHSRKVSQFPQRVQRDSSTLTSTRHSLLSETMGSYQNLTAQLSTLNPLSPPSSSLKKIQKEKCWRGREHLTLAFCPTNLSYL